MSRIIKGQVIRKTEKYIYTHELVTKTMDRYFIDFNLGGGRKAWGCTVYNSKEEAEKNIPSEAAAIGHKKEAASIRWQYYVEQRLIKHRYKKG